MPSNDVAGCSHDNLCLWSVDQVGVLCVKNLVHNEQYTEFKESFTTRT